jgi:Protein of unknown function (DUF3047)
VRRGIHQALAGHPVPSAALSYVGDNRLPPGTILPNAYTDRSRMIVLQSGPARVGEWVLESRDVYVDYQRAFGSEPPRLSGIAIMSDTTTPASGRPPGMRRSPCAVPGDPGHRGRARARE